MESLNSKIGKIRLGWGESDLCFFFWMSNPINFTQKNIYLNNKINLINFGEYLSILFLGLFNLKE